MKNSTISLILLLIIMLSTIMTLLFMPPSPHEITIGIAKVQSADEHLFYLIGKYTLISSCIIVMLFQLTLGEEDYHID